MLVVLKEKSSTPLYVQIYRQIKDMISTGQLREGERLPSTRALSAALAVGRNTVESAYAQLLVEGYVSSKPCSGYLVQKIFAPDVAERAQAGPERQKEAPVAHTQENEILYNFQYGQLDANSFSMSMWKKLTIQAVGTLTAENLVGYGDGKGERGLREEICRYVRKARGVLCSPDQIIVCAGTTYALLLLGQLLKPHSDKIAVEDPGYLNAREVFQKSGFFVQPVPVAEDGIDTEALSASNARIVYTTPSHQFPSGVVMSIQKRNKLLRWAEETDVIIIEDDYDSEFRYHTKPIPSICGVPADAKVIYLGTLSKILSPALRISYLVLPPQLMQQYDTLFFEYPSSVSAVEQKVLQLLMGSDRWEAHLRRVCTATGKKHDVLVQSVKTQLGGQFTIHGENAGLHILLQSRSHKKEDELIHSAKMAGVKVYPVSRYWIDKKRYDDDMVLLGFGGLSEQEICGGVSLLSQAWKEP